MLSDHVNPTSNLTLPQSNEICMKIARILVGEKFDMNNLASVSERLMQLTEQRLGELGVKPEDNPIWTLALMCEITLYIGIDIGINYSQEKEKNDTRTN